MHAQLELLLSVAAGHNITVQVLPFDQGEHDAMGGSLTVLTLPDAPKSPTQRARITANSSRIQPKSGATQ